MCIIPARMRFHIQGEHQMELLDCVAAKFHEEPGVFKLLVNCNDNVIDCCFHRMYI